MNKMKLKTRNKKVEIGGRGVRGRNVSRNERAERLSLLIKKERRISYGKN